MDKITIKFALFANFVLVCKVCLLGIKHKFHFDDLSTDTKLSIFTLMEKVKLLFLEKKEDEHMVKSKILTFVGPFGLPWSQRNIRNPSFFTELSSTSKEESLDTLMEKIKLSVLQKCESET